MGTASPRLLIGLMSGTSLDGIDAVVASFDPSPRLLHSLYQPFDPDLRAALLALQTSGNDEIHRAALAAGELARAYAGAIRSLLGKAGLAAGDITAIGCHGQTVRHRPDAGYTTQLVNSALLAELTDITVVSDFRSRDIAAGGQGAPLVPAFHRQLFQSDHQHRVIVNVGGIANITDLPVDGPVIGFDCGPGNTLMDEWIAAFLGQPYDRDGKWASTGCVLPNLFNHMFLNDYFTKTPPKSTGREAFSLDWVKQALTGSEQPQDVQATLLELTAQSIAHAIKSHCAKAEAVYVCGGGAHNRALMRRLDTLLGERQVADTSALGLDPDWVEALAFAWLAHQTLIRQPGNLPEVTGAEGLRILGAIYPA